MLIKFGRNRCAGGRVPPLTEVVAQCSERDPEIFDLNQILREAAQTIIVPARALFGPAARRAAGDGLGRVLDPAPGRFAVQP